MLVRPIVIRDEMQIQVRRKLPVQSPQEAQKLLMAVARQAFSHHGPLENIQGREQRRGAVALVACVIVPQRPFFKLRSAVPSRPASGVTLLLFSLLIDVMLTFMPALTHFACSRRVSHSCCEGGS
jgi:hypothetical protein